LKKLQFEKKTMMMKSHTFSTVLFLTAAIAGDEAAAHDDGTALWHQADWAWNQANTHNTDDWANTHNTDWSDWHNSDWGNTHWGSTNWHNTDDWAFTDWGNVDWVQKVDWSSTDWSTVDWGKWEEMWNPDWGNTVWSKNDWAASWASTDWNSDIDWDAMWKLGERGNPFAHSTQSEALAAAVATFAASDEAGVWKQWTDQVAQGAMDDGPWVDITDILNSPRPSETGAAIGLGAAAVGAAMPFAGPALLIAAPAVAVWAVVEHVFLNHCLMNPGAHDCQAAKYWFLWMGQGMKGPEPPKPDDLPRMAKEWFDWVGNGSVGTPPEAPWDLKLKRNLHAKAWIEWLAAGGPGV